MGFGLRSLPGRLFKHSSLEHGMRKIQICTKKIFLKLTPKKMNERKKEKYLKK